VHISELSGKHVELAEQVVSVGDEVFVKVIDIDLERRRISLSLKQANEGIDPHNAEFDSGLAALYGMVTEYDEQGNYKFPEGFDATSGEWLEGFDTQREAWEAEEAHKKQIVAAEETDAQLEDGPRASAAPANSSNSFSSEAPAGAGTLADDESLAALREKLSSSN
jgi:small subunit ribosomal protein S1